MKTLTIKTKRGLNTVTNLLAGKIRGAISYVDNDYMVEVEEYLKGEINHIVVSSRYHFICLTVLDSIREVTDKYEKKYDKNSIFTVIDSRSYLARDLKTWLPESVIRVTVRITE